jgi:hypothetical protein
MRESTALFLFILAFDAADTLADTDRHGLSSIQEAAPS